MWTNIYRQLVEVDTVEGEVLIVDRVESSPQDPGLHLVLLLWQQLQLDIRVTKMFWSIREEHKYLSRQ